MSERNGDLARFQKDRKRRLLRREGVQKLAKVLHAKTPEHQVVAPETAAVDRDAARDGAGRVNETDVTL
jgi:hypothetical protein